MQYDVYWKGGYINGEVYISEVIYRYDFVY